MKITKLQRFYKQVFAVIFEKFTYGFKETVNIILKNDIIHFFEDRIKIKRQKKNTVTNFYSGIIASIISLILLITPSNCQFVSIYIIAFIFKKEQDIPKFNEFIGEKDALTLPVSSVRKAFFIHGTTSDNERWLEHPLTERVLLFISNTDTYDDKFSWKPYSDNLLNDMIDRNKSAQELVNYVITNSQGFNEIVLIGHSHGGNVALQAVNQLVDKGKTVYLISVSTPAYNGETVKVFSKNTLQNCEYLHEYIITSPSITGMTQTKTYEYKNPENPKNTKLKQHLHLWNKEDGVAGGLAGDDYYKSNGITENIEIMTDREYSESIISLTYTEGIKIGSFMEFINAHGFDANRPQLIYKMLLNNKIKPIQ
ncbi:MAG: DUF2974 domain-containing protein [Prevotellaceae bacterium]|jgi:hypothetical protein|nr:DUF2974 domain-containing protein [Prevotellaceae bacterium]